MAQTQVSPTNAIKTPFSKPYKDIYIVNSNYNQYGHSVLPNYSKSILSNNPSHCSQSSSTAVYYHGPLTKSRESLLKSRNKDADEGEAFDANEDDDGMPTAAPKVNSFKADQSDTNVVELNCSYVIGSSKKYSKFNYKSLISPDNRVKRFLNRLDADSFSIFSKSSHSMAPFASIRDLPLEVMKQIISYVKVTPKDYKSLVSCLYVNKLFYKCVKSTIYAKPYLTSTYRVAQLVTTLREFPGNGELIKCLDLSKLEPGACAASNGENTANEPNHGNGGHANYDHDANANEVNDVDTESITSGNEENLAKLEYAYASWRDWKYRGDPLYGSSMLNSYNLSKSKSTSSVNSISTVSSMKLKFLKQVRSNTDSFNEDLNSKFKNLGAKFLKFKKSSRKKKTKRPPPLYQTNTNLQYGSNNLKRKISENSDSMGIYRTTSKQVKIQFKDPKNQPFAEGHPYTNKFLLKYSNSKDLPIGYILYFLELCPNIIKLNFSKVSLSTDFKIIYKTPQFKLPSLVEDVLPHESSASSISGANLLPLYLSDANVYFNMKTFQNEFIKLYDSDIIEKISNLSKLEELNLSSLPYLNFKVLRHFYNDSKALKMGNLKSINLLNSGMIRGLNWAVNYQDINEFKHYFQNQTEPEFQLQRIDVMRNVGMNY